MEYNKHHFQLMESLSWRFSLATTTFVYYQTHVSRNRHFKCIKYCSRRIQ